MKYIPKQYLERAETPKEHLQNLFDQTEESTEPKAYFYYTEMNQSRVRRLLKRVRWESEELESVPKLRSVLHWLVITEHWCGDAANSIPYMIQLADQMEYLEISFVYRDENPELINAFLTNGSKSIPKLIALDPKTGKVLDSWGPRPKILQQKIDEWVRDPEMDLESRAYWTQKWYAENKGSAIKQELLEVFRSSVFMIDSIDHMGKIVSE